MAGQEVYVQGAESGNVKLRSVLRGRVGERLGSTTKLQVSLSGLGVIR